MTQPPRSAIPVPGQRPHRPLDAWAVLRYSALFAVFVVPASFIALGLPATLLATWLIGRHFARRYRRQLVVRETLILALASWAWTLLAALLRDSITGSAAGVLAFQLAWQAVAFATTWAAYVWLARWVIRRQLGPEPPVARVESPAGMLARQKEQYAEATARGVTLAVAWLTVGAIGLPAIFIAAGLIAVVLGLFGLPVGTTTFVLVAVLGMPSLLAGFAWFVSRRTAEVFPSHRLIVWLRRFNRTDLLEFPFASFLERASRGIAVPVTLQDSTIADARTAASLRPEYYALTAAAGSCWFGFAISGFVALGAQSWTGRVLAGTLAALALVGFFIVIPRAMKRLGALRLGTPRGERLAAQLLDAIDAGQGVPQTLTILSCPDASWQAWVLDLVSRADAVLIDVTHLSPNLHWELRTIAERLDPQQVILAFGTTGEAGPRQHRDTEADLPAGTLTELAGVMGEEKVERSQRFCYALPRRTVRRRLVSMRRRRNGWLEVSKADTRRYGPRLAEVLNLAFAASDRGARTTPEDSRRPT